MLLVVIVGLLLPQAALGAALWSRGAHYAKLEFASDLSSSFSFGTVTMKATPPAGGNRTAARQGSGVDPDLGAYDELVMGPFAVRYFAALDAFTFERAYPAAVAAARPAVVAAAAGRGGTPCADLSGIYNAPGTGVGTGPGGVNVVSTISQHGCFITVGGESLCNGANATVLAGGVVNGTGGCLKNKKGTWDATTGSIKFGSQMWARLPPSFPAFELSDPADADQIKCVGWEDVAFAPATRARGLARCQSDGPLLAFHGDGAGSHATFAFSALDHFTTNVVAPTASGITVATQGAPIPDGTSMSTLLLARPGVNRAMRAWGSVMRQQYNTTRNRGPATTGLSYWDDNQAGYSYWSVDRHLDIWGKPEEIFVDLLAAYARKGIRFQSWETDQNFLGTMCPLCGDNDGFGWCWDDVSQWNTTLFPSGMGLSKKLGGLPMVFYISTMCRDNVYRLSSEGGKGGKYRFVNMSGWTLGSSNAENRSPATEKEYGLVFPSKCGCTGAVCSAFRITHPVLTWWIS